MSAVPAGASRSRRDPQQLAYGDALDFWRVVDVVAPHRLLLRAEMKLPGDATLEFRVEPRADGSVDLVQTARFRPTGLLGNAYWYSVLLHAFVFAGMLRGIGRRAEASARSNDAAAVEQPAAAPTLGPPRP